MTLQHVNLGHPVARFYGRYEQPHGLLARFGATLKTWQDRYAMRAHLAEMPEHLLQDMGISRGDALIEARKPFWQA